MRRFTNRVFLTLVLLGFLLFLFEHSIWKLYGLEHFIMFICLSVTALLLTGYSTVYLVSELLHSRHLFDAPPRGDPITGPIYQLGVSHRENESAFALIFLTATVSTTFSAFVSAYALAAFPEIVSAPTLVFFIVLLSATSWPFLEVGAEWALLRQWAEN